MIPEVISAALLSISVGSAGCSPNLHLRPQEFWKPDKCVVGGRAIWDADYKAHDA